MTANAGSGAIPPGALHRLTRPRRGTKLTDVSFVELSQELLARVDAGERYLTNEQAVLGEQLRTALGDALEIHENRFAARRYADLLRPILEWRPPAAFAGQTLVDLGCGSLNPFTFSFLLLMLGAAKSYAIDLEPIQDEPTAVRALATAASWVLTDPQRAYGSACLSTGDALRHLAGFDVPRLAAGDPGGIAPGRLEHRVESVLDLSLPDGSVDGVFSVSMFEHIDRVDDALESLRRITKPGGFGNHVIDFNDHRIYAGEVTSPFEFLKIASDEPLVWGSNRLRCSQFCERFEGHGFAVEQVHTQGPYTVPVSERERATFVEPYRSMALEDLSAVGARIVVRRR